MIEYLEDLIKERPSEEYVTRDGEGVVFKTGDDWFDSLNERVMSGENVTLEDLGVSVADRARLKAQAEANSPVPATPPTIPPSSSSPDTSAEDVEPIEEIEESYG